MNQRNERTVDVVICTIGRWTLATAIAAATTQTHPDVRVIVIDDSPEPEGRAWEIYQRMADHRTLYFRSPEPFGAGDRAKRWWLFDSGAASPFVRFLDDDDWMPPCALDVMMGAMHGDVALVTCQAMMLLKRSAGGVVKARLITGEPIAGRIGFGNALIRTEAAVQLPMETGIKDNLAADARWLLDLAGQVRTVRLPYPLYFYNAWRGNAERRAGEIGHEGTKAQSGEGL